MVDGAWDAADADEFTSWRVAVIGIGAAITCARLAEAKRTYKAVSVYGL